jgi:hypothetical protein
VSSTDVAASLQPTVAEVKCVVAEDEGWISKSITAKKAQDEAAFRPDFKFTPAPQAAAPPQPPPLTPPPPPQSQQLPQSSTTGKRVLEEPVEQETLADRRARLLSTGTETAALLSLKRRHTEVSDSQDGNYLLATSRSVSEHLGGRNP